MSKTVSIYIYIYIYIIILIVFIYRYIYHISQQTRGYHLKCLNDALHFGRWRAVRLQEGMIRANPCRVLINANPPEKGWNIR